FHEPRAEGVRGLDQLRLQEAVVHEAQRVLDVLVVPVRAQPLPDVGREDEALRPFFRRRRDLPAQIDDASHGSPCQLQSMSDGSSNFNDGGSGKRSPAAWTAGRMSSTKSFMQSPESLFFSPCSMA